MSWKRPGMRKGDHLVKCDRSGFTIPSSRARKQWDGLIVDERYWEARHPQDTIRVPREDMRIPDERPQPIDQFIGPLITEITAAAAAGSVNLEVLHTERMQAGDHVRIFLSSGDAHFNVIQEVTDLDSLILAYPLPDSVDAGAKVINLTAVAVAAQE